MRKGCDAGMEMETRCRSGGAVVARLEKSDVETRPMAADMLARSCKVGEPLRGYRFGARA